MADAKEIQWCDSTVNPIMGCAGCELFPQPGEIIKAVDRAVRETGVAGFESEPLFKQVIEKCFAEIEEPLVGHKKAVNTTNIWQLRMRFCAEVKGKHGEEAREAAIHAIERAASCYAAGLHMNRGQWISRPDHAGKKGYAPIFEHITRFPGRVAEMAAEPELPGRGDARSPWKEGLPRMIFVSDMGDAFSRKSDFDFLKREVMDPILSEAGRRHLWLWLTKWPGLMADFSAEIGGFPDNVCAMTTVTGPDTLSRIDELRKVDAKIRGLSLEPVLERIPPSKLDLEGIDWVIVGGESGALDRVREFRLEWVAELRDRCRENRVAFFVKQLGRKPTRGGKGIKLKDCHGGDWDEWDEFAADLKIREFPRTFHDYGKEDMKIGIDPRPSPKKPEPNHHGLTEEEAAEFRRLDEKVRSGLEAYFETGIALLEIRTRKLWQAGGHQSWEAYCKNVAGMSRIHAYRLMQAARIASDLAETLPTGNGEATVLPQSEGQVRPLAKLKDGDKQAKAWQMAIERADGKPTEREVKEAVVELLEPEKPERPPTAPARERRQVLVSRMRDAVEQRSWPAVEEALANLEAGIG